MISGLRDPQLATPEGKLVGKTIEGVVVRPATTIVDERGEICEVYNPAWGVMDAPLVYVYQVGLRPGKIKGWVYHKEQDDRLFLSQGALKIVLYDMRDGSPTAGVIQEVCLSERNRGLLVIPRLVVHAVQNIGTQDALFINLPTKAYNHRTPDKFRISMTSGEIPYDFNRGPGW